MYKALRMRWEGHAFSLTTASSVRPQYRIFRQEFYKNHLWREKRRTCLQDEFSALLDERSNINVQLWQVSSHLFYQFLYFIRCLFSSVFTKSHFSCFFVFSLCPWCVAFTLVSRLNDSSVETAPASQMRPSSKTLFQVDQSLVHSKASGETCQTQRTIL